MDLYFFPTSYDDWVIAPVVRECHAFIGFFFIFHSILDIFCDLLLLLFSFEPRRRIYVKALYLCAFFGYIDLDNSCRWLGFDHTAYYCQVYWNGICLDTIDFFGILPIIFHAISSFLVPYIGFVGPV